MRFDSKWFSEGKVFFKKKMRYYGSVLNNFQKGKLSGKKSRDGTTEKPKLKNKKAQQIELKILC